MNLPLIGKYSKSIATLVGMAISIVVQQEALPHPFTGSWWVSMLVGAGVVLGVYGVPNLTGGPSASNPVVAPVVAAPPAAPASQNASTAAAPFSASVTTGVGGSASPTVAEFPKVVS